MTILFFTRRFWPYIGGVEKHVLKLSEELLKDGHKIIIVTEDVSDEKENIKAVNNAKWQSWYISDKQKVNLINTLRTNNFKYKPKNIKYKDQVQKNDNFFIYRIPKFKNNRIKKIYIWHWLWKNKKLIEQSDVVHCHDVFYWYLPFKLLYFKKPVYTTFHGYENYPISKKAIIIRKISEILSNGNICIGDFISKWYGTKPTIVSYGAVEIPKTNNNLNKNKNSALFIGRLDEQTGIDIYNKAYKIINNSIPDFKFIVAGDGKFEKLLDKSIKKLGFVENINETLPNYRFAFVSRYLSILEAMVAKKLVFAVYDNPLKEDYLKMAPFIKFIIISNSADDLAEKVIYYLNNPKEEKHKIEEAWGWVQDKTWKNLKQTYYSLWNYTAKQYHYK